MTLVRYALLAFCVVGFLACVSWQSWFSALGYFLGVIGLTLGLIRTEVKR